MWFALLMMGCDRCEEEALSAALAANPQLAEGGDPAAAAEMLSVHCKLPDALADWLSTPTSPPEEANELWAMACPDGPSLTALFAQPRRTRLLTATAACDLSEDTVWMDGFPLLAQTAATWMTGEEVSTEIVPVVTRALTGQPVISFPSETLPNLPEFDDGTPLDAAPPIAHQVTIADNQIHIGDVHIASLEEGQLPPSMPYEVGRFRHHRHAMLEAHATEQNWLFAVDTDLPAETLSRIAISLTIDGGHVQLLGTTEDGLAVRDLPLPTSEDPTAPQATVAAEMQAIEIGEVPCGPAPDGMRCVRNSSSEPILSTFYIDNEAVTPEAYSECVRAGSCTRRRNGQLQWLDAFRYCTWAGKRLPTAWELLAVGENPSPVWSETWDPPGEPTTRDPYGPCGGTEPCRGHQNRIAVSTEMESHRLRDGLQARCATSKPHLTQFPAAPIVDTPPTPEPLTDAQLAIFRGIEEDPIWDKPVCEGDWGTVTLECRDPLSYVKSNERRAFVWADTVRNRGGAYVGVGSDQNYSYAALARAELVWLIDYDPDVVALHFLNRAFTLASESVPEFIAHYRLRNAATSIQLIQETYADHPDLDHFVYVYNLYRKRLYEYYHHRSLPSDREVETEWLRNPELYAHIRLLWQTNRIWPVKGDLTKHALSSIGDSARQLGVPVRIYYTSNAPQIWSGELIEDYKNGVLSLPMDERSIVLQTFIYPTGFGGPTHHHWQYNVQSGLEHQTLMLRPGVTNVKQLIYRRIATNDEDMTVSGLRSE